MSDKLSTDRADSASEAEQRMCAALVFQSERDSERNSIAFLRAWREAVREQVEDRVLAEGRALRDWVKDYQRDNAPQPAAPDDAQTLAVIVGSVADAMEDAGAALNVAESRARHVEKRLMESRVPAQPAPVAHGELSEIARIIARYHEGAGTEPSDEDRAAAREIHAHYERRAAQQRERHAEVVDVLTEMLDGYENGATGTYRQKLVTRCKAALDALAKHEEAT